MCCVNIGVMWWQSFRLECYDNVTRSDPLSDSEAYSNRRPTTVNLPVCLSIEEHFLKGAWFTFWPKLKYFYLFRKPENIQLSALPETHKAHSLNLKIIRRRNRNVRSLQPNISVSLSVDGDSSLQPDKPLHCMPGPAAQHLPWLLANDMGAGLVHGGHADYTGREGAGM